jgi:hypothetical protein
MQDQSACCLSDGGCGMTLTEVHLISGIVFVIVGGSSANYSNKILATYSAIVHEKIGEG